MASFDIAYNKYIKPNEGGYSNVAGDKGGETYGGIARNYHPGWPGWPTIDKKKAASGGSLKRNTLFPELDSLTRQFYLDWWNAGYYPGIQSQEVANLLFDYNINSASTAIKAVQIIVGTTPDGVLGPKTVAAINASDPSKVYNELLAQRKSNYVAIVANDPTQSKFWDGWMNRLKNFPELVTPKNTIISIAVIGLLVWGGYILFTSNGTKQRTTAAAV